MPRGYSRDLRERLLTMVVSGLSVAEVARRTNVSRSSLWRWRHLAAAGQSLDPKPSPGGPRKIGPEQEDALRAQVEATPDATLAEHGAAWAAAGHGHVSVSTMDRALDRLGLPLKKDADRHRAGCGGAGNLARSHGRNRAGDDRLPR